MDRRPIHAFPLAGPISAAYCGQSEVGDGWTALPSRVTCATCSRRVEALLGSTVGPPDGPGSAAATDAPLHHP